jgi:hypothetical protein
MVATMAAAMTRGFMIASNVEKVLTKSVNECCMLATAAVQTKRRAHYQH